MPRDGSNVFMFPGAAPEAGPEVEGGETRREEMRAIASCLSYLYGETMKLDRRMAAHLIGAAAESLREEIRRSEEKASDI